ncbi:receptor-like cytoplasmic kinase 176 [Heracleum sosnowskyi]|uniref:Receptor-like cytoplasmic kinase 176 n=1 Tax=Heracleum sosnowskyi TaxID=360622 RepID=A0AAD8MWL9_9APIA|nr:receptor-like cytoplasmic kinase 176 [Heracleum sosnowskyi]
MVSISIKQEGKKPCQFITPRLNVGDFMWRNAGNGNTNILVNNREISKPEFFMMQVARINCEGQPHFWCSPDGSFQEEGHRHVKERIYCKPIGKQRQQEAVVCWKPSCSHQRGRFGHVYKGWVDGNTFAAAKWGTGLVIAIKIYKTQGDKEWSIEINSVGKLCHPNIVKLNGYCIDKKHRLLVYEYMPQGSLDTHLFRSEFLDNISSNPINYSPLKGHNVLLLEQRGRSHIYVHSPETNVIHCEVKTSNILINSNYNAKLSDFELAKDGPEHEETHVSTLLKGTMDYICRSAICIYSLPNPMIISSYEGHITMKSDVYGFGVVLLDEEQLRWNIQKRNCTFFPGLSEEYVISDTMDADIKGQYTERAASKASTLALKCISLDPKSRPDANK